jgi:hypothetical protein
MKLECGVRTISPRDKVVYGVRTVSPRSNFIRIYQYLDATAARAYGCYYRLQRTEDIPSEKQECGDRPKLTHKERSQGKTKKKGLKSRYYKLYLKLLPNSIFSRTRYSSRDSSVTLKAER